MKISSLVFNFLLLLAIGTGAQNSGNEKPRLPGDRPNFILIVADDLGFADLGFTASIQIKTQHLLKKPGSWDVSLPHPLFLEGANWKRRQIILYDKQYQLKQPPLLHVKDR